MEGENMTSEVPERDVTEEAGGGPVEASPDAIEFFTTIEPLELERCVITESLAIVSESNREVGTFNMTVQFAQKNSQPCMLLHAQSHGVLDGAPCGTMSTAYLSCELDVLEEDYCEWIKVENHSVERKLHMEQVEDMMVIDGTFTEGEEERKESASFPVSSLKGLVTEGSSLLFMRLVAMRKAVPENVAFIAVDQQLQIIYNTFRDLGVKEMGIGSEVKKVYGVERLLHPSGGGLASWQCHFLDDGHLASRYELGSPVTIKLLHLPVKMDIPIKPFEAYVEKMPEYLTRQMELKVLYNSYLQEHPEVKVLLADFMQFLLLRKPDDVYKFAKEYFRPFSSDYKPEET